MRYRYVGIGWFLMSLTSAEHDVPAPARVRATRATLATPDLYRLISAIIAFVLIAAAAVSVGVVLSHRRSVDAILERSAPLVESAQDLYVALAAADAAASTGLLQPGAESPELRAEYHEHLDAAGRHVVAIAAQQDLSPSTQASVETIAAGLQTYAGLVELARANNLQGFPVGTAYLRDASDLMRDSILPAANEVYAAAAHDLDDHYRNGTSRTLMVAALLIAGVAFVLLVGAQVLVAVRSRRWLNPGLVGATLLIVALAGVMATQLESQRASLASSRATGSDPLLYASTSRILLLRSRSDENLYLIERLTESPHAGDFDLAVAGLGEVNGASGGSIDGVIASPTAEETHTASLISDGYVRYLQLHDAVRSEAEQVSFDSAADLAMSDAAAAADQLDGALDANVAAARTNLDAGAEEANDRLRALLFVALTVPLVGAAAAVIGIERRVREYR